MVMSRKRRNLLSKKRKNSKRNTKRNTKTHKNIRKMRGGRDEGGINLRVGDYFQASYGNDIKEEDNNNQFIMSNLQNNAIYKINSITDDLNNPIFNVVIVDREGDPLIINLQDGNQERAAPINISKSVLGNKGICILENKNADFEVRNPA